MTPPAPEILSQLETLELDPGDRLSSAMQMKFCCVSWRNGTFLEKRGLWIDLGNFAISGNIKSWRPMNRLRSLTSSTNFSTPKHGTFNQLPVRRNRWKPGRRAQIIVLTNLPAKNKQERIENLNAHGMNYPVIVGSGARACGGMVERAHFSPCFLS